MTKFGLSSWARFNSRSTPGIKLFYDWDWPADGQERAIEKFSTLAGTENQLIALLGNSGVDAGLPTLAKFLDHPSAELHGHAALALRFIDDEQADQMLARAR